VVAMGIEAAQLRDPDVIQRMQEELARGEALHKLDLLEDVKRLRKGGAGKVNATLASLKQVMGWAKPGGTKDEKRPDAAGAVAEIQKMLGRFGRAAG
jgi:hypothetical protein